MKKLIAAFAALAAFSAQAESLSVAATAVPHAEILEFV
ncbi:MAG TPA: methionine ABC transporter substrate-binding protein, partial [Pseudomonas sp.]|nr:methionine ABC transporter substrate-binding protein [Pseudomonas sp.]